MKRAMLGKSVESPRIGIAMLCHRVQTVLCTVSLCMGLALASLPGRTLAIPDPGIFLYSPGGSAYATVGYSIADSHVFDPDSVEIGELDGDGNIWNVEETSIIGYVSD